MELSATCFFFEKHGYINLIANLLQITNIAFVDLVIKWPDSVHLIRSSEMEALQKVKKLLSRAGQLYPSALVGKKPSSFGWLAASLFGRESRHFVEQLSGYFALHC